ncbi:MAG: c-type cytochrome [Myxococcota bacterium]
MKTLITVSTLALAIVFAGCDDDKVADVPPPGEEKSGTQEAEEADKEAADKADDEPDDAEPTYEGLAESYSELQTAYEQLDQAPAGLAPQMQEWGMQMMYMHENKGHMADQRDEEGGHMMKGMHGDEDPKGSEMGPHMPAHMSGFGEWHRQMSDFHEAEAKERKRAGDESIAKQHELMARQHAAMAESLTREDEREPVTIDDKTRAAAGESLYVNACATCHADDGTGVTDAFPPLAGADIVTGDTELLTRITLHGMSGPLRVKDQNYNGYMPSFAGRFSNDELAAILTYIRSSWGNEAAPVTAEAVAQVRKKTKDAPGAVSTIKEGLAPTVE